MTPRYRLYRVHKFVIAFINDISRLIAKTDFNIKKERNVVRERVKELIELLRSHAQHEETEFHSLLEAKHSNVHRNIQEDHQAHEATFANWLKQLDAIDTLTHLRQQVEAGYQFYLSFRDFEAKNLLHLNEEETVLMPELQRLYTDQALRAIGANTYRKKEMTPNAMVNMMTALFPYMNIHDRRVFLEDIHQATPDKCKVAFQALCKATTDDGSLLLDEEEANQLSAVFLENVTTISDF